MAIVFISRLRWLHLNRVDQEVRTTMVRHVRFGPLFVWHNPVAENKSPLRSTTRQTSFPASQIPYWGLRFVGVRFATPLRLAFSDASKLRLAHLHRWQAKKKRRPKNAMAAHGD